MSERRKSAGRRLQDRCKLPWMQFYIDDWATDAKVRQMGPIARAWYMELLITQWREGSIPDSAQSLLRMLDAMPRDWLCKNGVVASDGDGGYDHGAILEQVLECFEPCGNGALVNRKLQVIRDEKVREFTAKSEGCKRANSKRALSAQSLLSERQVSALDSDSDSDKERSKALVADATPSRPKPRRQMPEGFRPKEHHANLAGSLGVNLEDSFVAFREFHESKGNTFKDWDLALNTWLRNESKFQKRNGNGMLNPAAPAAFEEPEIKPLPVFSKAMLERRERERREGLTRAAKLKLRNYTTHPLEAWEEPDGGSGKTH